MYVHLKLVREPWPSERWQTFFERAWLILGLSILIGCNSSNHSRFFKDCTCTPIDLTTGITVSDSLGLFTFVIPDSSWLPMRIVGENENGLTVGEPDVEYSRLFNVNQRAFQGQWSWETEENAIRGKFEVVEEGRVHLFGVNVPWHLVRFKKDNLLTLYVQSIELETQRQYTLAIAVSESDSSRQLICELEPMLFSFRTN